MNLDKLEKLAKAVSPENWSSLQEFHKAADPETVLALIRWSRLYLTVFALMANEASDEICRSKVD